MKSALIDAGPLIALFDGSDAYHGKAISFLSAYKGKLTTTWPVITEASYFLDFSVDAQTDLLRWVKRGGLSVFSPDSSGLDRLIALMGQYRDRPMDLADGTLMVAAEELGIKEIISIDSDFDIYRTLKKECLKNIFR